MLPAGVYRIGSDEFVILTPNEPPYSVWSTADRMRAFLKEKDYVISVGIQQTADLRHLDEAVAKPRLPCGRTGRLTTTTTAAPASWKAE